MNTRTHLLTLTLGMLATATMPRDAAAHHSFAMFDNLKCRTINGTVRTFQWNFPHSWIWLDVPDSKGNVDAWGFEGEPPSNLSQDGWKKNSLKRGDKVALRYSPLRNGKNGGAFSAVTLPDGTVLTGARGRSDLCAPKK